MVTPLRQWQSSAADQFTSGALRGLKDQLAYVTPGGGKTRFALEVARRLIDAGEIKRLAVVVHTHNLRSQWVAAAGKLGLSLSDQPVDSKDDQGFVVTYQQLVDIGTREHVARLCTGRRKVLVIPDECHHMADGRNWGDNWREAFSKAHRRILLSGTPVRADDCTIPFVTYRAGMAVADFTYGYSDALRDGVVPPVFFPTFGGKASWKVGDTEIISRGLDSTKTDQTRRLNTMIQSESWLKGAIRAADDRLEDLRQHQGDVAGLIVCKDQYHAKQVAGLAKRLASSVHLAISDDNDAHDTIERFKRGHGRWLVTVRMVSEGIDIPRLRVGLYATNYRAELFFRQVVGRFVRMIPGHIDQSVFVYLPDHPDLVGFARDMAIDRTHIPRSEGKSISRTGSGEPGQSLTLGDASLLAGNVVLPGGEFNDEEMLQARLVRESAGLGYLPLEVVVSILRANKERVS